MTKNKKIEETKSPSFVLHLSEQQANVLVAALDFYSRIGCGQIEEVQNLLALEPHLNPDRDGNSYQAVKNALNFVRRDLFGRSGFSISDRKVPNRYKCAWDLQQVIRHKLAWTANPAGSWGVSFQEPDQSGKEDLATMDVAEPLYALLDALRKSLSLGSDDKPK